MKALLPIGFGAWIALIGVPSISPATLVNNGSFESMNFNGWTLDLDQGTSAAAPFSRTAGSAASVVSWGETFGINPLKMPEEGLRFAKLQTRPNANFVGNDTYNLSLNQQIQLNAGDTLSGWSSFFNGDQEPQDSAWVKIFDQGGNQIASPWQVTSGNPGPSNPNATLPLTATDWTYWEWQAPVTGSYSLWLGMTTSGNNNSASYGFFDGVALQPTLAVPEPGSLALVVTGTVMFALLRRKKR